MAKDYPRKYVVVKDGEFEQVVANDPVQETAIILQYTEALGLHKEVIFDDASLVIPDKNTKKE